MTPVTRYNKLYQLICNYAYITSHQEQNLIMVETIGF